jgi:hypothetical protein
MMSALLLLLPLLLLLLMLLMLAATCFTWRMSSSAKVAALCSAGALTSACITGCMVAGSRLRKVRSEVGVGASYS